MSLPSAARSAWLLFLLSPVLVAGCGGSEDGAASLADTGHSGNVDVEGVDRASAEQDSAIAKDSNSADTAFGDTGRVGDTIPGPEDTGRVGDTGPGLEDTGRVDDTSAGPEDTGGVGDTNPAGGDAALPDAVMTDADSGPALLWVKEASGTKENLHAIAVGPGTVTAPRRLIAVGDNGTVRTSLGGAWTTFATAVTGAVNLRGIAARTSDHFSIVGEGGRAFLYDGSSTVIEKWRSIATGITTHLNAAYLRGSETWVFGDAGAAYVYATEAIPPTQRRVYSGASVDFAAADGHTGASGPHIWAVGSGGTIVSYDGAANAFVPETSGTTKNLRGLFVTPYNRFAKGVALYAVGEGGTILHSTGDGTWTAQASGTTVDLNAVFGTSTSDDVFAVGANGTILRNAGGKGSWLPEPSGTTVTLRGGMVLSYGGSQFRYVVGDKGTIFRQSFVL